MPGLRSLALSAGFCRERRKLREVRRLQDRVGLPSPVEVSQGRGGAILFPFSLPLPCPPLHPAPCYVVPFPSFAFLCRSSLLFYQRVRSRFTYPFRPFHWNGEADRAAVPLFVPFGSYDPSFFSFHSVLLLLSAPRNFLSLVSSSSCSQDSPREIASSAYNYSSICSASPFVDFSLFSRYSVLFYPVLGEFWSRKYLSPSNCARRSLKLLQIIHT